MGRRTRKRSASAAPTRGESRGGGGAESRGGGGADARGGRGAEARGADAPPPPAPAPARPRSAKREISADSVRRTRPLRRHAKLEEAPQAPWHPFPLVELSILAGLILVVIGFASDPGEPRTTFLFGGLALISVASLELAIREHFAGYRSHTMLLAGAAAVAVGAPLWFTTIRGEIILAIAFVVGAVAFRALRSVFEKRAEGMSWRA